VVGAELKRGSNQIRVPRAGDTAWLGRVYTLLDSLPDRR
jgi:hypothetical protein